jgi:hypothetical protein
MQEAWEIIARLSSLSLSSFLPSSGLCPHNILKTLGGVAKRLCIENKGRKLGNYGRDVRLRSQGNVREEGERKRGREERERKRTS